MKTYSLNSVNAERQDRKTPSYKVHHLAPPIPHRGTDYMVTDGVSDGDDEDQAIGWGKTEQEAIENYLDQL